MDKKYLALMCVAIILAVSVGGFYGFKEYQSYTYDQNLKKSDELWLNAKESIGQTDIETKSYETNIELIKDSMNKTDLAINYTQVMLSNAPDNATKEYAQIRINQYNESKKIIEMYLKFNEDLKSSGIFGVLGTMDTFNKELDKITSNLKNYQNELIKLVNSNPELKARLNKVLGENRVKEIITAPGTNSTGLVINK